MNCTPGELPEEIEKNQLAVPFNTDEGNILHSFHGRTADGVELLVVKEDEETQEEFFKSDRKKPYQTREGNIHAQRHVRTPLHCYLFSFQLSKSNHAGEYNSMKYEKFCLRHHHYLFIAIHCAMSQYFIRYLALKLFRWNYLATSYQNTYK